MKRTKQKIRTLGKLMLFTTLICFLSWLSVFVLLIVKPSLALKTFIATGVFFVIAICIAVVWSRCLSVYRKKVIKETYKICNYVKTKEELKGNFNVSLIGGYGLQVCFYSAKQDVINEKKLVTLIKDNIPEEFTVLYEKKLQD